MATPGARQKALAASAARGRELAALLDSDTAVAGVTTGTLRPELALIAVPATTDGGNMAGEDFAMTAGWGHFGTGEAVMPGQGRVVERDYTAAERAALADAVPTLGNTTFDVYLNQRAYWRNVPRRRLELPVGRIPGSEEVAVVQRGAGLAAGAGSRRSAGVRGDGAPRGGGFWE